MIRRSLSTLSSSYLVFAGVALSAQGIWASADFRVEDKTAGNQHYSDIAADEAGGFLIAWESNLTWQVGSVFGKRYDAAGNAVGGEYLLAEPVAGEQQRAPRLCHRDVGGWAVVWRNTHTYGTDPGPVARQGVFGRFLHEDGTPAGDAFRVSSQPAEAQTLTDLDIACLPGGGFFAAWDSPELDGSYYGIFGQYVDGDGNLIGSQIQINTETDGEQGNFGDVRLAASPAGKILVLWPSNCPVAVGSAACTAQPDGSASSAQARLFDENGTPTGPEFRVNTTTLGTQGSYGMAAAFNDDEEFIVVFFSGDLDPALCGDNLPCGDLLAQRYDAAGAPVGGEIAVNAVIRGNQLHPDVVYDGTDGYLVVWLHDPPRNATSFDAIAGRRIGLDGTVGGSEFRVTSNPPENDRSPRLASHDGVHVVTWTKFGYPFGDRSVWARRLSGPLPECPEVPVENCMEDTGSALMLRDGGAEDSKLTWNWSAIGGAAMTSPQEQLTGYAVCIYEGDGTVATAASAVAYAECEMGGCWSGKQGRYRFRGKRGGSFAVRGISLNDTGLVKKIRLKASGTGAPMPRMREMAVPLTVQLISTDGQCWQAAYSDLSMRGTRLRARSR